MYTANMPCLNYRLVQIAFVLITSMLFLTPSSSGTAELHCKNGNEFTVLDYDTLSNFEMCLGDFQALLTGTIEEGDFDRLSPYLFFMQNILLQSEGGNFDEAEKFAYFFDEYLLFIQSHESCFSSCAIMALGGVLRDDKPNSSNKDALLGALGFHRPYLRSDSLNSLTPKQSQDLYRDLLNRINALIDMKDIDQSLAQIIISRDRFDMIQLSYEEKIDMRIVGVDVWLDELIHGKCGTSLSVGFLLGRYWMEALSGTREMQPPTPEWRACVKRQVYVYRDETLMHNYNELSDFFRSTIFKIFQHLDKIRKR